jgi:hypothetical protein
MAKLVTYVAHTLNQIEAEFNYNIIIILQDLCNLARDPSMASQSHLTRRIFLGANKNQPTFS